MWGRKIDGGARNQDRQSAQLARSASRDTDNYKDKDRDKDKDKDKDKHRQSAQHACSAFSDPRVEKIITDDYKDKDKDKGKGKDRLHS